MSSFVEALPDPVPRFHSPRVSTPLNLTPPDFGDFARKSYRRDVQTLREEGNERSVTPGINSERSSERMARGGSGSTAKQPFLEVLERCGKLEMENQVPLHGHETYLWAMCLMSMVVLTGAQSEVQGGRREACSLRDAKRPGKDCTDYALVPWESQKSLSASRN